MPPVEQTYLPDNTSFERVAPDSLEAPQIAAGLAAWMAARKTRRFPARHDLKPRDLAPAIQHMALLKVEGDDFVYRIVGDGIVRSFNLALQNRRVSDIAMEEPRFARLMIPVLREVAEGGEPRAVRGIVGHDRLRANFTDFAYTLLPLGPDDASVDHIMVFACHTSRPYLPKRLTR